MRKRRHVHPLAFEGLEGRVVLSRGAAAASLVSPVDVSTVDTSGRQLGRPALAIDQVNQAFNSFTDDFLRGQGAYFASSPDQAAPARRLFRSFIVERLNLLSEQLTRTFTQLPGSTIPLSRQAPGESIVLQSFLRRRITGDSRTSLLRSLAGTSLANSPIPSQPKLVTGSAASLYTFQATTAIEAARTATVNATGYLLNSTFHNRR